MNKQMLSIFQWRCLLVVLGLLVLSLDIWASMHWERSAVAFRVGTLGVSLGAPDRDNFRPIVKIADGSPLSALSATPGNAIKFDHPEDSLRVLSTDEPVGLTLRTGLQFRHALLTPMPDPLVVNQPFLAKAGAFVTWAQVFITLLLAMIIGWSRADSTAMRVFALILLNNSPFSVWNILPSGTLSYLLVDFRLVNLWIVYVGFAYFSLIYPEELGYRWGQWTRRGVIGLAVLFGLVAAARTADFFAVLPWALKSRLGLEALKQTVAIVSVVFSMGMLWQAWRMSRGTARQKLAWAGVCTGVIYLGYLLFNVNLSMGEPIPNMIFESCQYLTILIAYCALTYAMLRHRLFDFSFVVNRTLVFTVTSLLLFLAFWLIEQGVHKLVHFKAAENNAMLGGAIAFALFFTFNRLHHRVDHWIEHLFFRQWRDRESALRSFVSKAAHFTDSRALVTAFGSALDRFSSGAGSALYLAGPSGNFGSVYSSLQGAPEIFEVDDDIAVSMRASRQGVTLAETDVPYRAHLALPMLQGGELKGIVLLGTKQDAQSYRPDEQGVLEFAVGRIGLDLNRLQAAQLTEQLRQVQQELDSVKMERATLMLALSKVGAPA